MLDHTAEAFLVTASGGRVVHGAARVVGTKHAVVVVMGPVWSKNKKRWGGEREGWGRVRPKKKAARSMHRAPRMIKRHRGTGCYSPWPARPLMLQSYAHPIVSCYSPGHTCARRELCWACCQQRTPRLPSLTKRSAHTVQRLGTSRAADGLLLTPSKEAEQLKHFSA